MSFDVQNLAILRFGETEIWITETMRNSLIISVALIIFAIIVRAKLKKFKEIPQGFQNVVETMVESFDRFVRGIVGDKMAFLGNWYFMVFAFILLSNMSGMIVMFRPPTADWTVTFALAVVTLILIHAMAMRNKPKEHLKSLLQPFPLFLPLNIIGELARPISLSFRIFGNIFSGLVLTGLIYNIAPVPARFGLPVVIHGFFDVFVGFLQTYIFTTVSLTLISVIGGTETEA